MTSHREHNRDTMRPHPPRGQGAIGMDKYDAVGLVGLGLIVWGIWQIHQPTAIIAAGASLVLWSFAAATPKQDTAAERQSAEG